MGGPCPPPPFVSHCQHCPSPLPPSSAMSVFPEPPSLFRVSLVNIFNATLFLKNLFEAPALWADAFYKSKCQSVCVSVCLSVCLFAFEVPFKRLFALTSKNWMSNIFRDLESLGKVMGRSGLRFEHFCLKMV